MSCDNLCTAAKCEELENRISALEQALELIQASFEAHTQQDIPEAHNYNPPPFDFEPYINIIVNRVLIQIRPTLQIIIDDLNLHIGSDYTIVHNYKDHKSNLRIDGSFADEILYLTVADGESQDTATIFIPLPKIPKYEPSVEVNADIYDGTLAINVVVNDANDTATVDLPSGEQHQKSRLNLDGIYQNEVLTLTVADGESQDTASIGIPLPDFDNIINNYYLTQGEQHVKSNLKINGIYQNDDLTISISDGESQDTTTIHIPTDNHGGGGGIGYDGCGIDLAYENNLLTVNLTVGQCSSSDSTKIMEFVPIEIEQITCKDGVAETKLVTVAVIKGTEAAELEAYAARAAIQKMQCELEPTEVVSIVASDRVIARADGKILVLHFVQLDNYPKRTRGSTYWQVQIPAAKNEDNYIWENDFENLRWQRGNCYAELRFNEFKNSVSGFFANKAAANNYFDAVLDLTLATEKNRVYSEHKSPKTAIVEQETRPYRAFVETVDSAGRAICLIKFVPPVEPKP